MTSYQPPITNPAIFDSNYFISETEDGLTQTFMNKRYVRYPVAQGSETFPNDLTVSGSTTLNSNTTTAERVLQTLNPGGSNWDEVNGYYALDKTKNPLPTVQSGILTTSNWTLVTTPATNSYQDIHWSPEFNLFIAPCVNINRVSTSPDGINWTSITITGSISNNDNWNSCASGTIGTTNYIFCVSSTGLNSERVARSTNGTAFTVVSSVELSGWRSVCFSKELGLFVAVANSGTNRIMTTSDGVTWSSKSTTFTGGWQSVCWSPELGMFVAVASTGTARVMYSYDGNSWTEGTPAANNQWHSVCWSPQLGIFCAVSDTGTGVQHVMTSSDGINWTIRDAIDNQWKFVVWAADIGLFVATSISGTTDQIMTSRDGINWIGYAAAAVQQWHSVAWSPYLGIFCCVNDNSITNNKAMISKLDGQHPTNRNVFSSSFNNIDSSGNWTIKTKLLTNSGNVDINSTFGTTTIQSAPSSSILLNNHSIVNSNFQFPATFVSPSVGNLGYNATSTTQTNSNIVSGTQYNHAAFTISAGVWLIIMYSKFRKSAEGSPSDVELFNTTIAISTTTSISGNYYEKYQYGINTTSTGYTFPSGTDKIQGVSMFRYFTITSSTTIYLLNAATFTKNAGDQVENKTFAVAVRIA